jgi:NadR type nicotinamide-nucleotide adenylyltransferase
MEKGTGEGKGIILKIVLTGPECTAKSTLAAELADHYRTIHVPEYARAYIQSLGRPYHYQDVQHIARKQVQQFRESLRETNRLVFFDTYLVITRVWFDVVFNVHPGWIDKELAKADVDLYLLCDVDIPWVPDGVRENGGEMRERLYSMYRKVLDQFGLNYRIISGRGGNRLGTAVDAVDELLRGLKTRNHHFKHES